ncbi:MAG TPA: polysaccharide biosynthesis/export family protein [Candidatus Limnocylindria bacterium]|nr:polysaccharide biosynthesis/export family protein [Candidatus Limnocylindria bacterium]
MLVTVRGVSDWLKACCVFILLQFLWGAQAAYGQVKLETPQQTNEKIQKLADLARAHPVDTPIGSGDLLHIEVFDVIELTRDVRVSETGEISYPLIPGRIPAAGHTPFQLESNLEQLLLENGLVSHPQVSVFVKEQNSQPVSIVGAVGHPMVYQIIRPTTLLEILAAAGGIADAAGSVVIITRPNRRTGEGPSAGASANGPPADSQTITIHIQDLIESGNDSFNILVYGGDVVSVPQAGIVYVAGAGVAQPGGYVLQSHGEQITVLKAVALAHGLTGFAKANDAVIFRMNPATGQRDQIPVRIKEIEKNKTEDVAMKSNDVLYIPDSAGKKALVRGAEAAIGIGTAVAVYRVGTKN